MTCAAAMPNGWCSSQGRRRQPALSRQGSRRSATCCTAGGRTLAQGALGWILAKSPIALPVPGFTRPEQIEDNLGALDKGPLPAAVMAEIDAVLNTCRERLS